MEQRPWLCNQLLLRKLTPFVRQTFTFPSGESSRLLITWVKTLYKLTWRVRVWIQVARVNSTVLCLLTMLSFEFKKRFRLRLRQRHKQEYHWLKEENQSCFTIVLAHLHGKDLKSSNLRFWGQSEYSNVNILFPIFGYICFHTGLKWRPEDILCSFCPFVLWTLIISFGPV